MAIGMNDVGTRYEHLRDLLSDLEDALNILSDKVEKSKYVTATDRGRLESLVVTTSTIYRYFNNISGQNNPENETKMGRLIESLPESERILGGRGTPLC